MAIITQEKEL